LLESWLSIAEDHEDKYDAFSLIRISEFQPPSEECCIFLSRKLTEELVSIELLIGYSNTLGWDKTSELLANMVPAQWTNKLGDFGEMLSGILLEEFHNLQLPVRKLRYKISSGQTLPSTDIVAFKINDEEHIEEVHFVEVKARNSKDSYMALEAYSQLQEAYHSNLPPILHFIAQRLIEQNSPLAPKFMRYLGARVDSSELDRFHICLICDQEHWAESILSNLDQIEIDIHPMTVHGVVIGDLKGLVDTLFSSIPTKVDSDE